MFRKCKNAQEVRSLYKKLCLRLHPDQGGSTELMILLQQVYEESISKIEDEEIIFNKTSHNNDKFIYKGDAKLNILYDLISHFEEHENNAFVKSVSMFLDESGFITQKQYYALIRIHILIFGKKQNSA